MTLNKTTVRARAHTNIAVVKYWGKADPRLIIPQSSSLSLTLNKFYTDTTVQFVPDLNQDEIWLNHKKITPTNKIEAVLNTIRQLMQHSEYAKIKSVNHVPTSAGLASSASGLAALALAASRAAGLKLSRRNLSRLARHGSGSASRSIYGGWVEWQRGHNDQTSFAYPLTNSRLNNVNMIAVVIQKHAKKISSRLGMKRSVLTSPYYTAWKKVTAHNLEQAKAAIHSGNFTQLGRVAETNAMRMHALTISADPPFTYFNGQTIRIINLIQRLRKREINCYYTIDAGPNVKIMCQNQDSPLIKNFLTHFFDPSDIVISGPGPGAQILNKK